MKIYVFSRVNGLGTGSGNVVNIFKTGQILGEKKGEKLELFHQKFV